MPLFEILFRFFISFETGRSICFLSISGFFPQFPKYFPVIDNFLSIRPEILTRNRSVHFFKDSLQGFFLPVWVIEKID